MKRTIAALSVACILFSVLGGCGSQPSIEYDAKEQRIYVTGTNDYAAISFPDEIKDARSVDVEGDGFKFHAYLVLLRQLGVDEQTELPGLIDGTAKSLRFIRQYLSENAGAAYPSELAELPVVIRIDNLYGDRLVVDISLIVVTHLHVSSLRLSSNLSCNSKSLTSLRTV